MTPDDTNGYVDGEYRSLLPDQLGPWTQAESIRFEVAQDILGSLIASCAARSYRAEQADPPDAEQVKRWDDEQTEWARRRYELGTNAAQIEYVIKTYGPLARLRHEETHRRLGLAGELDERPRS